MASIELYINRQLCDIENPNNFSVYLKRQLLNPSELSTKDAQRSYDITLPASPVNNAIFGHTNTEEVKGKFSQLYDAMLYVDGVKIFDGKFRMSEITKTYYKGNLGIPAQKTVKDIFNNLMMNEAGSWMIPFEGVDSIGEYNKRTDTPPCFFPLVLYGLFDKEPLNPNGPAHIKYTPKDRLDSFVKFNRDNFPPSINCLKAIEKIFEKRELNISGSAFSDERLTQLYMSYKNPNDYEMPWNYGQYYPIEVAGEWVNRIPGDNGYIDLSVKKVDNIYVTDLLDSANTTLRPITGAENMVKKISRTATYGKNYQAVEITVPESGLYKIKFSGAVQIYTHDGIKPPYRNEEHDVTVISPLSYEYANTFDNRRFELKVMRDWGEGNFNLDKNPYCNTFYNNNIEQTTLDSIRHFPGNRGVNFVDPAQNQNLLCGLSFGYEQNSGDFNPLSGSGKNKHNPIAIKGGKSWIDNDKLKRAFSATNSQYYKYENGRGTITDEYTVKIQNSPANTTAIENWDGKGSVYQVVWLEKGEKITIVGTSDEGVYRHIPPFERTVNGWIYQKMFFNLRIEPFMYDKDWLKLNDADGSSKETMNWGDKEDFVMKEIDLFRFMPSDTTVDSWLENFCKAFNLDLIRLDSGNFELNTKPYRDTNTMAIIDLDNRNNVNISRTNASLNLPLSYDISFKKAEDEHGYTLHGDEGKEIVFADTISTKPMTQTSDFSYNWFKEVKITGVDQEVPVPVITGNEIWEYEISDYDEMKNKRYYDKPQRFWYRDANKTYRVQGRDGSSMVWVDAAAATDRIDNGRQMVLNYKNKPGSILQNYFIFLADADNCYTQIECYLTPEEYSNINNSLAKLNGDLYYIAEVDGYDPLKKKKTSLKLIRKQL